MQDYCTGCLTQTVCEITGSSCKKMDDLFIQRRSIRNGRTTMSNAKPTPKTVVEGTAAKTTEEPVGVTVVPEQATQPKQEKTGPQEPKDAVSTDDSNEGEKKISLVQRLKNSAEKNKKVLAVLAVAAVFTGIAIKKNRSTVSVEVQDDMGTDLTDPDNTTDSV